MGHLSQIDWSTNGIGQSRRVCEISKDIYLWVKETEVIKTNEEQNGKFAAEVKKHLA